VAFDAYSQDALGLTGAVWEAAWSQASCGFGWWVFTTTWWNVVVVSARGFVGLYWFCDRRDARGAIRGTQEG
jgi:hypothetical protein